MQPAGKLINTRYKYCCTEELNGGWDSIVGAATCHRLDWPGMEAHWG